MTLSPAFLDQLRTRTHLSTLVGRSVKLTRAGREWKACCPFHDEKTPSFHVNDQKGFYHCFGCGAHGDAIRWLTDKQGLPFMDAVKELAAQAGMEVPAPDPRSARREEQRATLRDVVEAAALWFREQLESPAGADARAYLDARGIGPIARERFGLGLAPARGGLRPALARFGDALLDDAGLIIRPDEPGRDPFDRFRSRLIIPIRDARGRPIAFGGRILGPGEPKYLNSPETPLFDKGRTLFNLDRAAEASRKSNRLLVVEGFLDVVALDGAGIHDAVAPLGTALTEAQMGLLWRHAPDPVLLFDGDGAGTRAASRAARRALPGIGPGRTLRFATLPPGQDPDDLVRAEGANAIERVIAAAVNLVDRLWAEELAAEPLTTPEARAGLRARLITLADEIADRPVRDQYRAEFLDRFAALREPRTNGGTRGDRSVRPEWKRGAPPQALSPGTKRTSARALDKSTGRALLHGLARFPDVIATHGEALAALKLADRALAHARDALLDRALTGQLDIGEANAILADAGVGASGPRTAHLAFSFARPTAQPERARSDLVLVIESLATRAELDAALASATQRLKETGSEEAWGAQLRLAAARDEADARLAALAEQAGSEQAGAEAAATAGD